MTDPQNHNPNPHASQQPPYGQPYQGQQYGQPPQPGAPQYGAPQYGAPPQPYPSPAVKKKKKWPWVIGGLLVLLIIVIAATSGGGSDESSNTAESGNSNSSEAGGSDGAPDGEESAPGLNTKVRDGKFEFVVTGVEPGLTSVGDNPYLTEQAQGQFVIVSMTVTNTSNEPKSFSPSDQKLFDNKRRSFEPSSTAQIALGGSDIPVWDNINPGNAVEVKVVYDMPKDAVPASIELHDSVFSDGVKVTLS
ncbi:DUF4352 domain-containing protein [Gordonia lacunae]|uniref:Mpr protein n=1 Tax=Gordonia lacunae TaxID=417102 RepID=A0A243Q6W0_9ACTN|nr:DUF4352 domain-containing protein [Gordonia lacunae]OUC77263.1 Mpr protein [Gordonia lacunae]